MSDGVKDLIKFCLWSVVIIDISIILFCTNQLIGA